MPVKIGSWIKFDGFLELNGEDFTVTIEPRPSYCDRGNWIAKLSTRNFKLLEIDEQDGWPRYYMDLERAKLEINDWLKKRNWI